VPSFFRLVALVPIFCLLLFVLSQVNELGYLLGCLLLPETPELVGLFLTMLGASAKNGIKRDLRYVARFLVFGENIDGMFFKNK